MGFFVAILFAVFAVVAAIIGWYNCSVGSTAVGVVSWLVAIALVIGFICVPFSIHTVDAGEVAVVKVFGKTTEVKSSGLHYDFWVGKSYKYIDLKDQELTIEAMTYSSDAQVMNIALTVQYRFLADKAMDIVNEYGDTKALASRITSVITEAPKAVLANRTAMEIIANRGAITPEVQEAVEAAIGEQYPVAITKVAISNIDFSDAFEQAVEEKMIAEQNKLKADYENEKKVATAKANAEAKKIEAEGEAEANRLLENSLTENVLRDKYLDKWDGKLPSTMVGDDTSLMVSPNAD
jgi:regulator of protease activity HflC (stomatin/prohibitin superfamily)